MSDGSNPLSYAVMETSKNDHVLQFTGKGWRSVSITEALNQLEELRDRLQKRSEGLLNAEREPDSRQ